MSAESMTPDYGEIPPRDQGVAGEEPEKDWHIAEQERAERINRIVDLGIMPETVSLSLQAGAIDKIIGVERETSAVLRDERNPEEKGRDYYRLLLRRTQRAHRRKSA